MVFAQRRLLSVLGIAIFLFLSSLMGSSPALAHSPSYRHCHWSHHHRHCHRHHHHHYYYRHRPGWNNR